MKLKESLRTIRKKISKKTAIVAAVLVLGIVGGSVAGVRYTSAARGDCDGNAVMYCGAYDKGTLKNKYDSNSSVRSIFAAAPFGISNAEFQNSLGSLQDGEVHRNGEVKIGSKVVATNAITAGRHYIAGSTKMNGVNAYARKPSVSFTNGTWALKAYVKFDSNGRFEFAIIKACGNPVTATPTQPPANPGIGIEKKVKKAGTNDTFKDDISVNPSDKVEYVVSVKNTGNVALTNVHLLDALPKELSYVGYTTKVVRSYGGESNIASITTGARNIGTIPVHGTAFVFFQATAPSVKTSIKTCDTGKTRLRNTAYVSSDQTGNRNDYADIQTCKPPAPKKPAFEIEKKVKKAGTNDEFMDDITVNPGDTVEYVVAVKNTGDVALTNMWVRDELPQNVRYVGNTTKLVRSYASDMKIGNIVGKGVNIGTVPVHGTAFIFFQATAPKATDSNVKECKDGKTDLRNVAFANPDVLGRKEDDAYIKTCKTVTPKNPDFKIVKSVKIAGTTDEFAQNVVAAPGTRLTYVIGIQNTGNTTLKDIVVKDVLPAGITYVNGSATITTSEGVKDKPISDNLVTSGYTISSLGVNQTAFIFFDGKLPEASNPIVEECEDGKTTLTNKATAKPENLPVKEDDATAQTCKPPVTPVYECTSLDAVKLSDLKYRFTPQINKSGNVTLTSVSYNFGDGSDTVVRNDANAVEHAYTQLATEKTYTTTATVTFNVNGEAKSVNCTKQVKIPAAPVLTYECTSLDAVKLSDLKYRFTPQINKSDSVTVKSVSYNYGDGSDVVVRNDVNAVEHTYTQLATEKIYTTTATVTFSVGGEEKSVNCVKQVKIPAAPVLTYECTSLGKLSLGDLKYRFTPQVNMSSSVSVTKVSYDFGDGSDMVVRNDANAVEHTYVQTDVDKTYTTTATVTFSVGGEEKSVNCAAQVTVTAVPDEPCEYNPDLPKDSPDCKPPVTDVCPDLDGVQTNPDDCKEVPVTPPTTTTTPQAPVSIIPATGLGGALSGLVGTFAATYGGYALLEARRKRA